MFLFSFYFHRGCSEGDHGTINDKGQIYYRCNHSSYLHRCTARSVCHYSCPRRPHSRCPVRSRPSPRCSRCSPPGLLELAISVSITGEEEELTRSSLQTGPAGQGEATRVITSLAGLLGNIHRNKIFSKLKYTRAPHHRFSPCMEATYLYDRKNQRKGRNTPSRGFSCLELSPPPPPPPH